MTNPSSAAQAVMNACQDSDELETAVAAAFRAAALYCRRDAAILLAIADQLEQPNEPA